MSGLSLSVPEAVRPVLPGRPLRLLPDDRLARLAARGNQAAVATLYERHHQGLYRYCRSLLGRDEDAQDALQNTMLKAMSSLPGDEREMRIKPWLYRVAHNESITILRGRRSTQELGAAAELAAPSGSDPAIREELRTLIADLGALPERQRGALVMRELSGLSYADIAVALDTSLAGAKQIVYEARVALNDLAEGREMDCEAVRTRISAADRRLLRGRKVRGHLRSCSPCRAFEQRLSTRPAQLAAFAPPLPAVAATGVLQSVLGAGAGAGGAAAGAAGVGGAAAGPLAGSVALKAALASVAVVAAGAGAVQLAHHHGSAAVATNDPHAGARSSTSAIPATEGATRNSSATVRHQAGNQGQDANSHRAARPSASPDGGPSAHGPAGSASSSPSARHASTQVASARTTSAAPSGDQSSSSGDDSSTASGHSSGTPVGPSHGRTVAQSHVPPQALPHVSTHVPAVGHGAPTNLPGGGTGVPPGDSGSAPGHGGGH